MNLHEVDVGKMVSTCEAAISAIRLALPKLQAKLGMPGPDAPDHARLGWSARHQEFDWIESRLGLLLTTIKAIHKRKLMGKPPGKGRAITPENAAKIKRWLREGKPCSVGKLAEKLDVSRQTIYNFLKENPPPEK